MKFDFKRLINIDWTILFVYHSLINIDSLAISSNRNCNGLNFHYTYFHSLANNCWLWILSPIKLHKSERTLGLNSLLMRFRIEQLVRLIDSINQITEIKSTLIVVNRYDWVLHDDDSVWIMKLIKIWIFGKSPESMSYCNYLHLTFNHELIVNSFFSDFSYIRDFSFIKTCNKNGIGKNGHDNIKDE